MMAGQIRLGPLIGPYIALSIPGFLQRAPVITTAALRYRLGIVTALLDDDWSFLRLSRKARSSRFGITCRASDILMTTVRPLYMRLFTMNLHKKSSGVAMSRVYVETTSTVPSLFMIR